MPTSALLALLLPLQLLPAPLAGQSDGGTIVEYTAPDEYQVTRPMACPTQLTGGFLKVVHNGGNVVECGSGGGTAWELAENIDPYASSYDPYAAGGSSGGGCSPVAAW